MKEFDIYLNKRLTECDIIVYSIPYRDGLTAINQMILESCVESYTLTKFVALQTGSELVAHIDDILKICQEKLNYGVTIGASAEFETHKALYSDEAPIVISANNIKMLANSFIQVNNAMQFGVQPIDAFLAKPLGRGRSEIEFDAEIIDTLKHSIEKGNAPIEFGAEVGKTNVQYFSDPEAGLPIGAELVNLCYRIYDTVETAMQITAQVLDTEIHYSLGAGESGIEFGSEVADGGDSAIKHMVIENVVGLLSTVTESIRQFMAPETSAICYGTEAAFILKRCRLLEEMDGDNIATYDNMTLEEVDYVIL